MEIRKIYFLFTKPNPTVRTKNGGEASQETATTVALKCGRRSNRPKCVGRQSRMAQRPKVTIHQDCALREIRDLGQEFPLGGLLLRCFTVWPA